MSATPFSSWSGMPVGIDRHAPDSCLYSLASLCNAKYYSIKIFNSEMHVRLGAY
jgi:hypothetical protein